MMGLLQAFTGRGDTDKEVEPPKKLDTVFKFYRYKRDFNQFVADLTKVMEENAVSFRVTGNNIGEKFHRVFELQLLRSDEAHDPELKSIMDDVLLRRGVTSFGAGPHFDDRMVVFLVRYTKYIREGHEMPIPTMGSCFYVDGDELRLFPGPKFPMSHLLNGVGSERDLTSVHEITNEASIKLKVEFKEASWFYQDAFHRVVLPGMPVSDFLSLYLEASGESEKDDRLIEPFFVSEICLELQEFLAVRKEGRIYREVRRLDLLRTLLFEFLPLSRDSFSLSPDWFSCELPNIGPTFFTKDLTRSYGLNVSVRISHKSIPNFNVSVFIELNVAQEQLERVDSSTVKYFDAFRGRGCKTKAMNLEDTRGLMPFLIHCQRMMHDCRYSFVNDLLQCLRNGSLGCIHYAIAGYIANLYVDDFFPYKPFPLRFPWQRKEPEKPVVLLKKIQGSNSNKPHVAKCLVLGDRIVGVLSIAWNLHQPRARVGYCVILRRPSNLLHVQAISADNDSFWQPKWGTGGVIGAGGMRVSELIKLTFTFAKRFDEARVDRDIEIKLKHINLTFVQWLECADRTETVLLDEDLLASLCWSEFKESVPGSLSACAATLPGDIIGVKIPHGVKRYKVDPYYVRFCYLKGELHFSIYGSLHSYKWETSVYMLGSL